MNLFDYPKAFEEFWTAQSKVVMDAQDDHEPDYHGAAKRAAAHAATAAGRDRSPIRAVRSASDKLKKQEKEVG